MRNQTNSRPTTACKTRTYLKRGLGLATTLILILSFALPNHVMAKRIPPEATGQTTAIARLSLKGVARVLVVAPHPDDETIAAGGLIQSALANGSQVRVVIVTNGDGQLFAPAIFTMEDALTPAGYVAMGERRQAESLAALKQLGVPPENILFLGYPDRGLAPMLTGNWNADHPYTAPFTRAMNSPYPRTFHPRAAYCGEGLSSDLETILSSFRPDLIVLPHPADQHADHQATSHFTSLAVAALQAQDPTYQPGLWTYLVHYGNYPKLPEGDRTQGFLPPSDLARVDNSWGVLPLTPGQEGNKSAAIRDYPTQMLLLGKFLPDFARAEELFMLIPAQVSHPVIAALTGMEIPVFENTGFLPAMAGIVNSWHTSHPYRPIHCEELRGSNQEQDQQQPGDEQFLSRQLASQPPSKRFMVRMARNEGGPWTSRTHASS